VNCAENDIVGEALIALLHDDLKSMGINSVGHRLTILKSVYDVKKAQDVPIESDHYVPLCMFWSHPHPLSRWSAEIIRGPHRIPNLFFLSCRAQLTLNSYLRPCSCRRRSPVCDRDAQRYQAACRAAPPPRRTHESL